MPKGPANSFEAVRPGRAFEAEKVHQPTRERQLVRTPSMDSMDSPTTSPRALRKSTSVDMHLVDDPLISDKRKSQMFMGAVSLVVRSSHPPYEYMYVYVYRAQACV